MSRGRSEGRPAVERRQALLGEVAVDYRLCRTRRRTVGLTIDADGLRVGAPLRMSVREVESMLGRHAEWVLGKLIAWQNRPERPQLVLQDGARFPFLGQEAVLVLQAQAGGRPNAVWGGDTTLRMVAAPEQVLAVWERALKLRAQDVFQESLARFCKKLDIVPPRLFLSSAKTRWGSCNRRTGVRINWRLVHAAPHLIDYVVAHELSHLEEMNHSARFWRVVERIYPEWKSARLDLRTFGESLPHFSGPT